MTLRMSQSKTKLISGSKLSVSGLESLMNIIRVLCPLNRKFIKQSRKFQESSKPYFAAVKLMCLKLVMILFTPILAPIGLKKFGQVLKTKDQQGHKKGGKTRWQQQQQPCVCKMKLTKGSKRSGLKLKYDAFFQPGISEFAI